MIFATQWTWEFCTCVRPLLNSFNKWQIMAIPTCRQWSKYLHPCLPKLVTSRNNINSHKNILFPKVFTSKGTIYWRHGNQVKGEKSHSHIWRSKQGHKCILEVLTLQLHTPNLHHKSDILLISKERPTFDQ